MHEWVLQTRIEADVITGRQLNAQVRNKVNVLVHGFACFTGGYWRAHMIVHCLRVYRRCIAGVTLITAACSIMQHEKAVLTLSCTLMYQVISREFVTDRAGAPGKANRT